MVWVYRFSENQQSYFCLTFKSTFEPLEPHSIHLPSYQFHYLTFIL
jgi:hypothetical protein